MKNIKKDMSSKLEFVYKVLTFKFYIQQRGNQFLRLMTNTSVLPSILFAIVTISTSFFLHDLTPNVGTDMSNIRLFIFILTIALLISSCIFFGRVFFNEQPPEVYAEYSLAGTTPSHSFIYISYSIWKECNFITKSEKLFSFFNEATFDPNDLDALNKFKKKLKKFDKNFEKRYDKIQKINFMMFNLAKSMNLPAHRISDFLFQFSPDIYHQEIKKSIHNMHDLYFTSIKSPESTENSKFSKISSGLAKTLPLVAKRKNYQKSIILHKDLHMFIIGMSSSGFGLSNAFGAYCLGLQYSVSPPNVETSNELNSDTIRDRVLFIYHKRRMYPGFDLHAVLYRFACYLESQNADKYSSFHRILAKVANNTNRGFDSAEENDLRILKKHLVQLPDNYEKASQEERNNVYREFIDKIKSIISGLDNNDKLLIISQGYSSVVNYALKRMINDIKIMTAERDLSELGPLIQSKNIKVDIYILENSSKKNAEKLISRYLRYKFKENPNIPRESKYLVNVKIGNFDWLKSQFSDIYTMGKLHKVIVSGAEFILFSEDKKTNRIMNNEGVSKVIKMDEDIIKRLEKKDNNNTKYNKAHWFVLAEKFKIYDENLDNNIVYKIAMSNDYLENLKYYDRSDDRIIVSGMVKTETN